MLQIGMGVGKLVRIEQPSSPSVGKTVRCVLVKTEEWLCLLNAATTSRQTEGSSEMLAGHICTCLGRIMMYSAPRILDTTTYCLVET
jgi:hypothetical protein